MTFRSVSNLETPSELGEVENSTTLANLVETEQATHEDEEQRADRTLDWIGSRIASRSSQWVDAVENGIGKPDNVWRDRTPWWEEVKRCIEGDLIPNRLEGWNHPIAGTLIPLYQSKLTCLILCARSEMYADCIFWSPQSFTQCLRPP